MPYTDYLKETQTEPEMETNSGLMFYINRHKTLKSYITPI